MAGGKPQARDARQEAFDKLGGRYEVRVLEPSPPAVRTQGVVEDAVARGEVPAGRKLVAPYETIGELTWNELAAKEPGLSGWCTDRWLGPWPRLAEPPSALAETRDALHLLAEHVVSPTRARDLGEITLRWTLGGFGTPFFGKDSQLRIEGDLLVVQHGSDIESGRITTLRDAAEFVGFDLTRFDALPSGPLAVDPDASAYLSDVYGFAFSVLEELRAQSAQLEPSLVNLWPEHFDVAVEIGDAEAGRRAAFGVSPGDGNHPEPYVYVAPWTPQPESALWQATGFSGAELSWRELIATSDQRATALIFLRERLDALSS